MDPAAGKELDLQKQDTDLGQTLGVYGVGHGFYIVWPFFGPSSPRDSRDPSSVNHFCIPSRTFIPGMRRWASRSFESQLTLHP